MPRERLCAGIMSGTSVDGIDVALVRLNEVSEPLLVYSSETPFDPELRTRILAAAEPGGGTAQDIASLNFDLARAYADALDGALRAAAVRADELDLIGCHGQTIAHLPGGTPPATL